MKKTFALLIAVLASPALAHAAATVEALTDLFGKAGGPIAIAAGICMGIAVIGGTFGQARVAAAALDGTARNPAAAGKFTAPLFVGLALIESLVLLAFVIAFTLLGQNSGILEKLLH